MISILNELLKLRDEEAIVIERSNSNRYRVVANEKNGTQTAYYFGTPIYDIVNGKILDLKFNKIKDRIYSLGSNARLSFSNKVQMENAEGNCTLNFGESFSLLTDNELRGENVSLFPTTNGFMCKLKNKEDTFYFDLEVNKPFMGIRANDKCFCLMGEKFRPFVNVSCIGTADSNGEIISPSKLSYQKLSDNKFRLGITGCSLLGEYIMFEVNLYESKLVHDTTVESGNPQMNNAFGSVAFIGTTEQFGEQWLYLRPDYAQLSEIIDKRINKMILHIPKLNTSTVELSAYKVMSRFCSFGSNWNNKVENGEEITDFYSSKGYQSINLAPLLVDSNTKVLTLSEGLILKPKTKQNGFSAIATGDSCFAPQILEINFK